MTGLVRKATFLVACMVLGAAAAYAGIVSPGNCSITRSENNAPASRINLVGYNSGGVGDQADSLEINSKIIVTVRDVANNPIAGVPVVVDFSGCTSDVKIGNYQSFHGQTVGCAGATVQGYSTALGQVTLTIIGGRSAAPAHAAGCATVFADSYNIGSLGVGTFDQTNTGGITLADISLFWTDINDPGPDQDRSDVDGNAALTLADVSYAWTANSHAASFNASSAVLCP